MTSPENYKDTMAFFENNNYFGENIDLRKVIEKISIDDIIEL